MRLDESSLHCVWLRIVLVTASAIFQISPVETRGDPATLDQPASQDEMLKILGEINRRIASNANDAGLYLDRGEARFKLREFNGAIEDFTKAIRLDDRLDNAYFGRGMALGRSGRIDKGITDLTVYIQRHPESSVAYTKRGVRYIWKGDLEKAEKDLSNAVFLDPRNAEAHDDLGVILAQHGNYPSAIVHFQTSIKWDPSYQKAYHNLAMVYYITDQTEKALSAVNQSLKLNPEWRDSLLLKSSILEALGRHGEAKILQEEAEFLPQGNPTEHSAVQ
jgi:tetratricopeptide (TPR) repeat protein